VGGYGVSLIGSYGVVSQSVSLSICRSVGRNQSEVISKTVSKKERKECIP